MDNKTGKIVLGILIVFLFKIAVERGMVVHQMDVKTAFLNANLEESIFVKLPPGFRNGSNLIWKLKKALYGLKQAQREWNNMLNSSLISHWF